MSESTEQTTEVSKAVLWPMEQVQLDTARLRSVLLQLFLMRPDGKNTKIDVFLKSVYSGLL